jgi:hypothetical protein
MENRELKICELYKNGVKSSDICKECHCSTNTISKILDKYNIPKRQPKKMKKDLSKFYDLDNPETQYWIGYICADGNIVYDLDKRQYRVSLYSKDYEIIDKFIKYFGKENVSVFTSKKDLHQVYIDSKELASYFINTLNIIPNKSLVLDPNIPYTSNFILGYFDGDGWITNSTEERIRYECGIVSGSEIFIDKVKEIIDSLGIYCNKSIDKEDGHIFRININKKSESEKFYKWLYKDSVVYLSRKFNNFVALYGNIKENKLGELLENSENQQPSIPLTKDEGSETNS